MSRRRPGPLVAAAALTAGLAGCSSAIPLEDLEAEVAAALERELGALPEVRCEEELPAEVDAATECVAVAPGSREELALRITVTSVTDDRAEFDIEAVD